MNFPFKQKRLSSVLGLSLSGNRLEAVVLRRSNGTLLVRQSAVAALALPPLTGDPQLVGREIRNHLDQAGVRERKCVVALPLSWALTMQTKLPDISGADLESFLQIEAERGFPSGSDTLYIAHSRFHTPSGENYATLLGIPRNHLDQLEKTLRAARLKPLRFVLGVTSFQVASAATASRSMMLAVCPDALEFYVAGGGGIVALRSLDAALESEGNQKTISAELVAREIRITLGQLPGGFGEGVGQIKVFGQGDLARQFVSEVAPRLQPMDLQVEMMPRVSEMAFEPALSSELALSPAVALAAGVLHGEPTGPDFLPPKVHPWQQLLATRLSPKRLAYIGGVAGAAALLVLGLFGWQQWQISTLESTWSAMSPTTAALDADQQLIRKYRSWYDRSFKGLRIIKKIAESFPEDGAVSAKSVEIRDLSEVTCSGMARDNQSFLTMHAKLGDAPEISNLHAETHGQAPLQFTLNYQFEGAPANGN